MKRFFFLPWLLGGFVLQAQTPYRADIKTVVSASDSAVANRLFMDAAKTPAPLGSRLWFVADRDGNGVPLSPSPGAILGPDDVLLLADAVDGSLLGSQVGRFGRNGVEVPDRSYATADIYLYLWNSNQVGDFVPAAGNSFGLFKIGKVAVPEVGNAIWSVTGDVFVNQFTVNSGSELLTTVELIAEGILLKWTGGRPPYTVQSKSTLVEANWADVITTNETQVTVPLAGDTGYVRVTSP